MGLEFQIYARGGGGYLELAQPQNRLILTAEQQAHRRAMIDGFHTNIRKSAGTPESFHVAFELGCIQSLADPAFQRNRRRSSKDRTDDLRLECGAISAKNSKRQDEPGGE